MTYQVYFNDDRDRKEFQEIEFKTGGWVKCVNPNFPHAEAQYFPQSCISEIREQNHV